MEEVDYKNVNQLRRYVSEKGKIRNRRVTGACRGLLRDCGRSICLIPPSLRRA